MTTEDSPTPMTPAAPATVDRPTPALLAGGPPLRTTVVIDYQNVHLVGHGRFPETKDLDKHLTLVDPGKFARKLLRVRCSKLTNPAIKNATLTKVLVYRGEPSAVHHPDRYARNQAQKAQWERDPLVRVRLRPLKYHYNYVDGQPVCDEAGVPIPVGFPQEKGVDVLVALACVREATEPDTDLVILASEDSDLSPVLDEVLDISEKVDQDETLEGSSRRHGARIETFSWFDARVHPHQIRSDSGRPVWNTRLNVNDFVAVRDLVEYP